jgi:hypothetical protein
MDTIILGMVVAKKDFETKSLAEILELGNYRETLGTLLGSQNFDNYFNEIIL